MRRLNCCHFSGKVLAGSRLDGKLLPFLVGTRIGRGLSAAIAATAGFNDCVAADKRYSLGLMSRHTIPALAFVLVSLPAFGAVDNEGYDEYTIRRSDIPKDAPRFKDYPAKPYAGPNAAPDVRSDPRSRMYRTQLRGWATEKPNFAGHYILATWGCGTGCTQIAVIDALTGKVFHPPGARTNSVVDVHDELLVDGDSSPRRADFGALRYSADSRLLVLIGTPEERTENRGISYFVWENDGLRRVRLVPKAWYSEKK